MSSSKKHFAVFPVVLSLSIIFLFFVYINSLHPLLADDFSFLINNFANIISIVKSMYFNWTGTFTEVFLLNTVFLATQNAIYLLNIINALTIVVYICGVFFLARVRFPQNPHDAMLICFIVAMMWFCLPGFWEVFLWKTGQIAYLTPITGTLYLIYPFCCLFFKKNILKDKPAIIIALSLASFLLSGFQANMGVTISILFMATILYQLQQKETVPVWTWCSSIAYWIGTLLVIIAPGNYIRVRYMNDPTPFIHKILPFLHAMFQHYWQSGLLIIYAFACILYSIEKKHPLAIKRSLIFVVLALCAAGTMIGAPGMYFFGRTTVLSDTFFIIAIISLMPTPTQRNVKILFLFLSIACISLLIPSMITTAHYWQSVDQKTAKRNELIQLYKNNHIENINLPFLADYNDKTHFLLKNHIIIAMYDINSSSDYWINKEMADFYRVKTVHGIS